MTEKTIQLHEVQHDYNHECYNLNVLQEHTVKYNSSEIMHQLESVTDARKGTPLQSLWWGSTY